MTKPLTPDYIYQRALQAKENSEKIIEQAKVLVPEPYHDFIVLLNETKKLSDDCVYIDDKTFKLGVWHKEGFGTIQTLPKPYMNVNGRIKWARDDHKESQMKLNFHPPVISSDNNYMSLRVESEMLGEVNVITEIPKEKTNFYNQDPLTFAHTKAKGKALGDLGYGLIGDGVSSAEEAQDAIEEPIAVTPVTGDDNEPKEVSVMAVSEPEIFEQYATFKGTLDKDDYTITIPIGKIKEIQRIKRGFMVTGYAWFNGGNIRFSTDNSIHVVDGKRSYELALDSSPKFSPDGSSVFHAYKGDEKLLIKAPSALKEELKDLQKGDKIKADGFFLKGVIQLPRKNNIEVISKIAG
ncbi:hypothetical protein QTG56_23140 (plasmid) [Rossellomorea sp. AcN35-11]|nr:hypothetical protein [Rossellomorea aquimaris]WJV32262.1 hypothetical protein QTG56_23140 [Rossellomorea sp. AcN35-11]